MRICRICNSAEENHGADFSDTVCPIQTQGRPTTFFWAKDGPDYDLDPTLPLADAIAEAQAVERDGNLGEVIDRRIQVYGGIEESWSRIAQVWSGIAGFEITASTAALMMIGLKSVRATYAPDYADNSDDVEGYLDIFRKLVGEDMIHVRSVNEYIAAKWPEQ
jgi:hypothetical protein